MRGSSLTWAAQRTQDSGFHRMPPPPNQSPATAPDVPLHQSSVGLACSSRVERPFWWKVQGLFMAGGRLTLDVTDIPEDVFPVMAFKVHTAVNGQPGHVVASCNGVFGGMEHREGVLSADTAQLFLAGTTAGPWRGTSAFLLLVGQSLQ